jgi:colanic acid biosynthesis glycosyl transferase WcaI
MVSNQDNGSNKKINVMVITPQYAPDFGPSAPIYTALCEDLHQIGCDVTVITAFPHYAEASANFRKHNYLFEEEMLNGVRVIRTYVYTVPKGSLWRRLLYHASFNIFSTLALIKTQKPDIVLADAPTLWSGLPLILRSILSRVPFIYIIHDIYPDVLSRLGVVRNQRILNLIEKIEQFFYRRASQISVLSDGFKNNLLQKSVPEKKITVIPVCVDIDFIKPLNHQNELSEAWRLKDKFVILYAGNIGRSQGLETTLAAAKILLNNPTIEFIIVGEGAMKAELQAKAEKDGLTNVKFIPFQTREKVPMVYALADVCLVSLKQNIVVESVPSKTYTIMAAERPIIATIDPGTEVGCLLRETQCGLCIEPENPQSLVDTILELYHDDALRINMGRRGREVVVEKYSRHVAAMQYYKLIRQFANR